MTAPKYGQIKRNLSSTCIHCGEAITGAGIWNSTEWLIDWYHVDSGRSYCIAPTLAEPPPEYKVE